MRSADVDTVVPVNGNAIVATVSNKENGKGLGGRVQCWVMVRGLAGVGAVAPVNGSAIVATVSNKANGKGLGGRVQWWVMV